MKKWLEKKTVLITGASGGIGFNVAKILIEKYDCTVYGVARKEDKLLSAKEKLSKPQNFIVKSVDISKKENIISLKNYFDLNGVKPDIIINNAGFMLPFIKFDKLSYEEIDEIVATDFLSVIYLTKEFIPIMGSSPAIVNISSAAGICSVVGESMYCATKYAVRGFTDTIRQEYKKDGFYVCGVYPGFIKTNILNRMDVLDKENKLISKLMMPVEKASKIIVKGMLKRKKNIVMGYDGRLMSFFGKRFPLFTSNAITKVLKTSKLQMFSNVFDDKKE